MVLNKNEHRFQVRSSDYLFFYYNIALWGCLLSLFILNDGFPHLTPGNPLAGDVPGQRMTLDPSPVSEYKMRAVRTLLAFTVCIAFAFFFEALPRNKTRVQRESREKEGLTEYDQANLFSRWTFHYAQPLMSLGARKTLTPADVDEPIPEELSTHHSYEVVSRAWERRLAQYRRRHRDNEKKKLTKATSAIPTANPGGPSLLLTVLYAYRWRILPTMIVRLASFAFLYVPVILFRSLLQFFVEYDEAVKNGSPPPAVERGLLISVGIFVGNIVSALLLSLSSNECTYLGLEARAALIAMIYRKALRLSPASRGKSTLGEISRFICFLSA